MVNALSELNQQPGRAKATVRLLLSSEAVTPVPSPLRNQLTRAFARKVAAAVEAAIASRARALVEKNERTSRSGHSNAADQRGPSTSAGPRSTSTNGRTSIACSRGPTETRARPRRCWACIAAPCSACCAGTRRTGRAARKNGSHAPRPRATGTPIVTGDGTIVLESLTFSEIERAILAWALQRHRGQRPAGRALARPRAQHVRRQGESLRAQGRPRGAPLLGSAAPRRARGRGRRHCARNVLGAKMPRMGRRVALTLLAGLCASACSSSKNARPSPGDVDGNAGAGMGGSGGSAGAPEVDAGAAAGSTDARAAGRADGWGVRFHRWRRWPRRAPRRGRRRLSAGGVALRRLRELCVAGGPGGGVEADDHGGDDDRRRHEGLAWNQGASHQGRRRRALGRHRERRRAALSHRWQRHVWPRHALADRRRRPAAITGTAFSPPGPSRRRT